MDQWFAHVRNAPSLAGSRPLLLGWRPPETIFFKLILVRLKAVAIRLEAVAIRLEAVASRLEAIASRLEAIAFEGHSC